MSVISETRPKKSVQETGRVRISLLGRLYNPRVREVVFTIILLPLALIWIYPFLWMISASLKTDREIFQGLSLIPDSFQWSNYERAWVDARVGDYFVNTLMITLSSVLIVVVTTAMMGYVLGRYNFPGKRIVVGFFIATVFLPEGYTIIPVFELINWLGIGNSILGIILGQSGGAHVVTILLFAGYFSQLPKELEE
ncbi:MAG: carbohydrate ABC transporter permease, partial [Thermomicrobiales bacterium]